MVSSSRMRNQPKAPMPILIGERSAPILARIVARSVDLLVALALFLLLGRMGSFFGFLAAGGFLILQEGLGGQTLGKKLLGLRTLDARTSLSCSLDAAVIRNLPFVLSFFFGALPGGSLLFLVLGAPLLGLEAYLVLSLETGTRLGDVLAVTRVVEVVPSSEKLSE